MSPVDMDGQPIRELPPKTRGWSKPREGVFYTEHEYFFTVRAFVVLVFVSVMVGTFIGFMVGVMV